ncbi:NADP-dependent oxidoreductase [Massilia putida]|uniref:NADP-dependent oxidoreductase n=1 Tax=Massilia putida TaxID=1141883 RepID=UPI000952E5D2|nr:NADP-dependent oxidoreductase [Massilia putida]
MEFQNQTIRVAKQVAPGSLEADAFELRANAVPELKDGEILVRIIYISIDAGSRAQFDDRADYVFKTAVGQMPGSSGAVGEIVASRDPQWPIGELVATGHTRWQRYQKFRPGREQFLVRIDPAHGPLPLHLGALGLVGFTAYIGVFDIGQPAPGETFLVSAAAGATGALAGQFARIAGARVVGIAGGAAKCAFVRDELGFDDCVDYKQGGLREAIARACPAGVDVYYENVGGEIQKAAFANMNDFGRVALCGQVAQYSGGGEAPGPNLMTLVLKRLTVRGFLAMDHMARHHEFIARASAWYREGRLKHHATITPGLENMHEAINSLVEGRNLGKQLCQVGPEPS